MRMDSYRARPLPLEAERVMAVDDDDAAACGSSMSTVGAGEPRTVSETRGRSALSVCVMARRAERKTHRRR